MSCSVCFPLPGNGTQQSGTSCLRSVLLGYNTFYMDIRRYYICRYMYIYMYWLSQAFSLLCCRSTEHCTDLWVQEKPCPLEGRSYSIRPFPTLKDKWPVGKVPLPPSLNNNLTWSWYSQRDLRHFRHQRSSRKCLWEQKASYLLILIPHCLGSPI